MKYLLFIISFMLYSCENVSTTKTANDSFETFELVWEKNHFPLGYNESTNGFFLLARHVTVGNTPSKHSQYLAISKGILEVHKTKIVVKIWGYLKRPFVGHGIPYSVNSFQEIPLKSELNETNRSAKFVKKSPYFSDISIFSQANEVNILRIDNKILLEFEKETLGTFSKFVFVKKE